MTQDKCTIQVNGVEVEARPGQMLIEVTDAAGIYVPRFCYHSKLTIAANCRMCLVEVENAPKPMPACATPVTPGMKVHTKSTKAIGAQRATMEFLLINHPLDCPICDQGGECELQDLAMGFGRDISRYSERKRVVRDKDIGPLVSTDMTRCIHCTRCVRFTQEIAGFQELGTIGRGDRVEISPYLERAVSHELSGNIIDLCPVGALNSKPYRFSARAWELVQHQAVAPHDCLGSRLFAHVLGGEVKRVVPEACDAINETWISDRDRFGYEGLNAPDRLREPMIREDTGWRSATWDEALDLACRLLGEAAGNVGALVSPGTTTEEGHLLARIFDRLGSASIDHRLRRRDVRGQASDPVFPWLGMDIAAVEGLKQVLVVGSNIRAEVPLLAHRIRKAALAGAGVTLVNPARFPILFPVADELDGDAATFWLELAKLVEAAGGAAAGAGDVHRRIVARLRESDRSAIFLGQISMRHPRFAEIDRLARELARLTGSALGYVPEGANAAGLALAGVLPHRSAGGKAREQIGQSAAQMAASPPRVCLLFGVEPSLDCAWKGGSEAVIAFSPFFGEALAATANVVLPLATFTENAGTFVNAEGRWQSFSAVSRAPGHARPGWKVLRVLANRLGVPASDYDTVESIRDELRGTLGTIVPDNSQPVGQLSGKASDEPITLDDLDVPMYGIDGLVRRSRPLQETVEARRRAAPPPPPERLRA